MLSGEYNLLVDNINITDILSVILLLIPIFLLFFNSRHIFTYYIISIVANLPLIFYMTFNFSYELIIVVCIILAIIKDIYKTRDVSISYTSSSNKLIVSLIIVLVLNIITSFVNLNFPEVLIRGKLYLTNLFILFLYLYYINKKERLEVVKNGALIGAGILVVSIILELIYGYYTLGVRNLRPAGLLLDPNVSGFALNLCLIISFYKVKNKSFLYDIALIILRLLIVFSVFLTVSRSSYIGTFIILIFMVVYYSKPMFNYLALTVVIVFIVMYVIFFNTVNEFIKDIFQIIDLDRIFTPGVETPTDVPGVPGADIGVVVDSRIELLIAGVKLFYNNFLIGVGIGNVPREIGIISGYYTNTHNLILQFLTESGFIMIFALIILGYYLFKQIRNLKGSTKFFLSLFFVVILVESLFNHNLLNINLTYVIFSFYIKLAIFNTKDRHTFIMKRKSII